MRKTNLWTLPLIILCVVAWGDTAWGYSATHKWINNVIYSDSTLDEYFAEQLGVALDKGKIGQTYLEKTPFELFEKAGTDEDDPWTRALNHFHNPTKDFEHAGYTKLLAPDGISSILWAQYPLLLTPPDSWWWDPNTEWNWQSAIDDFYAGLTSATTNLREARLAHLFANLGHLTHLVADVSVPEHTRNDTHLWSIENWCAANITSATSPLLGTPASRAALAPAEPVNNFETLTVDI